jgi:hypothetical protein
VNISHPRVKNEGIELVIDERGEAHFPGYKSLARVCSLGLGKPIEVYQIKRTIESLSKGGADLPIKDAKILTHGGLQGGALIPRKIGNRVIQKHNPNLFADMADLGSLVYLHQLCGFKIQSTPPQVVEPPQPAAPRLSPSEELDRLVSNLEKLGIPLNNPRYQQYLQDAALSMFIPPENPLPSAEQSPRWLGVAERAEELGYSSYLVSKHRSQLGKYVAKQGLESTQEKRLCQGTMRDIYLYPISDELDQAIHDYFSKLENK